MRNFSRPIVLSYRANGAVDVQKSMKPNYSETAAYFERRAAKAAGQRLACSAIFGAVCSSHQPPEISRRDQTAPRRRTQTQQLFIVRAAAVVGRISLGRLVGRYAAARRPHVCLRLERRFFHGEQCG